MSHYKKVVTGLDSWNIILSAAVCGACVIGPDTFFASEDNLGVFGKGTRLAMPRTICAPDTSSLKPGSGATEGVLD